MKSAETPCMHNKYFQSQYLAAIDFLIKEGLSTVGTEYKRKQADYVSSQINPDGGFPGRLGRSDLYYTDFALRTLDVCESNACFSQVADYVEMQRNSLTSVVDCFNWLNCVRILEESGISITVDAACIENILINNRAAEGIFTKGNQSSGSIYGTFLAILCCDMLGLESLLESIPPAELNNYRNTDGGFSESPASKSQTNATAAAVSIMVMIRNQAQPSIDASLSYISHSQRADGGLSASEEILYGDLLSSYTGIAVLAFLGNLELVDLGMLARFLKSVERKDGGFRSCAEDSDADIEYTYYGLAILGILRTYLTHQH